MAMLAGRRNHDDDISQVLAWVSAKYGGTAIRGKSRTHRGRRSTRRY